MAVPTDNGPEQWRDLIKFKIPDEPKRKFLFEWLSERKDQTVDSIFRSEFNFKKVITVTIDSNCINEKRNGFYLNLIDEAYEKGLIKIYKTDTMDTEFIKKKGYPKVLKKSEKYEEDMGIGVWGNSRWGHFKWGDLTDTIKINSIKSILFPKEKVLNDKQLRDCLHLKTHIEYKRDYFITSDKEHILNNKEIIEKNLLINVVSPKDFCKNVLGQMF